MPKANSKKAARSLPGTGAASAAAEASSSSAPLFEIDTAGSSSIRHALIAEASGASAAGGRLRKGASFNRPLKSDQILAMRSSEPALTSRRVPTAPAALAKRETARRERVDRETKERLKKIVGRDGQGEGLWGVKSGELVVREAQPGTYDAWEKAKKVKKADRDLKALEAQNALRRKADPKAPETLTTHKLLTKGSTPRAIPLPHPGMSYNPAHPHHQALLADALVSYTAAEARDSHGQEEKDAMDAVREGLKNKDPWLVYEGEVGSGEDDSDAEEEGELKKTLSKRKTRQQRNKKIAHKEELERLAEIKAVKARLQSVSTAKALNKTLRQNEAMSLEEKAAALKVRKARLESQGLTRFRSGPIRVPDATVHFQLGEELADNLRTLEPEGNLWRDWVGSGMRRGKVPVERSNINKKGGKYGRGKDKGSKTRERETYAYKNFKV